jgi:uncharacterized protein YjbI with pentapeptide repeats
MANEEHLAKLNGGVEAWNEWRRANPGIRPDLRGASFKEANLIGADLSKADLSDASLLGKLLTMSNLSDANLTGADLSIGVDLRDADLRRATLVRTNLGNTLADCVDLSRANLTGANLQYAILSRANFRETKLYSANLTGARLNEADLSGASAGATVFANNYLGTTKGLETVQHDGPSIIGIDTIYSSHGKIPLSFLRGAGVPEILIEYMPSLVALGAIQFYSCFISYSTKDQEFADRLYADLQNKGVRCWFAPHDVQGGKKLHEQIDEAIRRYERLLLILSPNSMSSKWVKTEIRNARKREVAEKKRVLFPVRLASYEALRDWKLFDGDEGEDLATEIREYYIPDFSEWKNHDLYAREFEKLLRDLRTDESRS